jgi:hypothetical protein
LIHGAWDKIESNKMSKKVTDKNERASAMLAKFKEKELFRAALKAGKLQFVAVDGKAK